MNINNFDTSMRVNNGYTPSSVLQQHSIMSPFFSHGWSGVGGFATPPLPSPPLCAPPMTVASSLGNPQMPSGSMFCTNSPMGYNFRTSSHCKRKLDDIHEIDDRPTKQHINEERMAASLDSLHLSTKYTEHTLGAETTTSASSAQESLEAIAEGKQSLRLYLSDEITNFPLVTNSSVPESILKNYKRDGPCLEVVLWKPRTSIIPLLSSSSSSSSGGEEAASISSSPNPTPPESSSPVPSFSSDEDSMELSSMEENNNVDGRISAYTRSWVEENNNTGLRDRNPSTGSLHQASNDEMDLDL